MEILCHFFSHLALAFEILPEPPVIVTILPALFIAFKVVVAGRAFFRPVGLTAMFNDLPNPPRFSCVRCIQCVMSIAAHIVYAFCNMVALGLQHIGEVELERRLITAHDKQIGETRSMNPEQRPNAILILILQVDAALALDIVIDTGLLDLETGGID